MQSVYGASPLIALALAITEQESAAKANRREMTRAWRDLGDVVYYLSLGDGLVKIGHSRNLRQRISDHGRRPIDLLAVEPGGSAREMAVHRAFSPLAVGGEKFRLTPRLLAHINQIRDRMGIAAI